MRSRYEQRLDGLEAKLLQMSQLVQTQLSRSLEALRSFDAVLAEDVMAKDELLDHMYAEVEQEILRTLALQAPVATDLRLVAGVLHANAHLERMGDLCVNIARFARAAAEHPPVPVVQSLLQEMGGHAERLVAAAMTCFIRRDVALAEQLLAMDEPLDRLNQRIFLEIEQADDDQALRWASRMILAARYLERIGDHAVDIGEEVIFIVTGEVRDMRPPKAARGLLDS